MKVKLSHIFLAYLLVGIQFLCIGLIFLKVGLFPKSWWFQGLYLLGVVIGIKSIADMGLNNTHIASLVDDNAVLIQSGLYKIIRNPMYLAVIIVCGAMVADQFEPFLLLPFVTLIIVLLTKIFLEEKFLQNHFSEYNKYKSKTKRIIPFVF